MDAFDTLLQAYREAIVECESWRNRYHRLSDAYSALKEKHDEARVSANAEGGALDRAGAVR